MYVWSDDWMSFQGPEMEVELRQKNLFGRVDSSIVGCLRTKQFRIQSEMSEEIQKAGGSFWLLEFPGHKMERKTSFWIS